MPAARSVHVCVWESDVTLLQVPGSRFAVPRAESKGQARAISGVLSGLLTLGLGAQAVRLPAAQAQARHRSR